MPNTHTHTQEITVKNDEDGGVIQSSPCGIIDLSTAIMCFLLCKIGAETGREETALVLEKPAINQDGKLLKKSVFNELLTNSNIESVITLFLFVNVFSLSFCRLLQVLFVPLKAVKYSQVMSWKDCMILGAGMGNENEFQIKTEASWLILFILFI